MVQPGRLLIYYAYPSGINGATSADRSAAELARYSHVVLGEGLADPAHPDHGNTRQILASQLLQETLIFGYVDLGVTTQNLTPQEIARRIDRWGALGVRGVLLDDFGYDFGVTRQRQNAAVAHGRGLAVVANAFVPEDAFLAGVDPEHNPTGVASLLGAEDYYLYESHQVRMGEFVPQSQWLAKQCALAQLQDRFGFSVFSVTTTGPDRSFDPSAFGYARVSAWLAGHTASGWGEPGFSAATGAAPSRQPPSFADAAFAGPVGQRGWRVFRDTGS